MSRARQVTLLAAVFVMGINELMTLSEKGMVELLGEPKSSTNGSSVIKD